MKCTEQYILYIIYTLIILYEKKKQAYKYSIATYIHINAVSTIQGLPTSLTHEIFPRICIVAPQNSLARDMLFLVTYIPGTRPFIAGNVCKSNFSMQKPPIKQDYRKKNIGVPKQSLGKNSWGKLVVTPCLYCVQQLLYYTSTIHNLSSISKALSRAAEVRDFKISILATSAT